ncbi:PREDICTED: elongation of very long chain fatty acids protein 4-like isoform X2 [Branchiostoma belcheri]|uniref:Elongation of very long chain fatty acids protein n=1 Tax=Branchiostoma belcheri TaxID=7741 RepID=A0A6P5AHM4_BRABE|nr:PREDICTED: elongation of very long chain fatty acids protein 4-like isoform X2 [Branchiostoma belcheri]
MLGRFLGTMDLITDKIQEGLKYYEWCLSFSDPRVADWPLMDRWAPTLYLTAAYLLIVWLGPRLMEKRKPMELTWLMVPYNFATVLLNLYICVELVTASWSAGYSYSCQRVNYSYDVNEVRIASALWWYFISKLLEFADTFFFIVRKKNSQISFLHVYHHTTMFALWWVGIKWVAGGQSFFGAMMNSGVHVLMYTYYGLSAMGPRFQKYLWWKKYMTVIQLTQFFIAFGHCVQSLYVECDFPGWMHWGLLIYATSLIALFGNFYIKAYKKPKTAVGAGKTSDKDKTGNGLQHKNGFIQAKKQQ